MVSLIGVACGYHVGGQATRLPADLRVIAVPAFQNETTLMRLEQRLTRAVMEEFIRRTDYRIVGSEQGADAVLRGTVSSIRSFPIIFDPDTGRASAIQVEVSIEVELFDARREQTLFVNRNYVFREQYEVTSDLDSFFEERNPALDRLARDFAAALVTSVLENF